MSDVTLPLIFTILWCVIGWLSRAVCEVTVPGYDSQNNITYQPPIAYYPLSSNTSSGVKLIKDDKGDDILTTVLYEQVSTMSNPFGDKYPPSTQGVITSSNEVTVTSPTAELTPISDVVNENYDVTNGYDLSNTSGATLLSATMLTSAGRPRSDEENLFDVLFDDVSYNPSARPVINSSQTVPVQIQFSLMHIKDLDVRSQIFTTTGLLILIWPDERLKWLPRDHNGMQDIIIEARELWRPEFAVINGAEKIYEDYNEFRAVITHEGIIHWEPGGVFKTMCTIDITYYPFDEQVCSLTFGAWSYHTSKMNLTNLKNIVNLDSYNENGEWHIFATEVERKEFSYECCPNEKYSNVNFMIYLRRRHTFYILNVILPSIMTSVLLLSIFFCTPGQKVQIGVVVLLSFRIFLLNVSGEIPKTSDHIPLLGIYLTCTMAITTLSMVLTVFVLNLHYITDRPVPPWAKKIVFVYMARAMGMCAVTTRTSDDPEEPSNVERRRQPRSNNGNFFRRSYTGVNDDMDETAAIFELQNRVSPQETKLSSVVGTDYAEALESPWILRNSDNTPNHRIQGSTSNHISPTHYIHNNIRPTPMEPVDDKTEYQKQKDMEKEKTEEYGKDWKRMAEIFDRLFFWLFLLAILITTLVLFHPLTKPYMSHKSPESSHS